MARRSVAAVLATLPASVQRRNARLAPVAATTRPVARTAPQRATATPAAGVVVVTIDGLRLVNEANARDGHGWGKSERAANQRAIVTARLPKRPMALPLRVCVSRIGPQPMDTDGLANACKGTRDAVAAWLGVRDCPSETRVVWRERQETAGRGVYGVRITLTPLDGRASVTVGDVADVVRVDVSRDQAGDVVASMLDRRGGHARVEVAGVVIEMRVEADR